MNKIDKPITSFEEFVKRVQDYGLTLSTIYRGQGKKSDPLLPSIARPQKIGTSLSPKDIIAKEKKIFGEFRRLCYPHLDLNLDYKNEWNMLALAQHHRLPTRLLDWTGNALAALWFACKSEDHSEDRVVWILVTENDHGNYFLTDENLSKGPFKQEMTKIFRPNHITKRITNQIGWFTVHKIEENDPEIVPLDKQEAYKGRLFPIIIPGSNHFRATVLNKLEVLGINNYSLFPDLDGLCLYLKWKILNI